MAAALAAVDSEEVAEAASVAVITEDTVITVALADITTITTIIIDPSSEDGSLVLDTITEAEAVSAAFWE